MLDCICKDDDDDDDAVEVIDYIRSLALLFTYVQLVRIAIQPSFSLRK